MNSRRSIIARVVVIVLGTVCWLLVSAACVAQAPPQGIDLRYVRETYKADNWPRGVVRDGFPLLSLDLKGWKGEQLVSESGQMWRKYKTTTPLNRPQWVVIDAYVGDTIDKGHEALLIWLAGRQSPAPAPNVQDQQLKVGDVGYMEFAGRDSRTISWIAFVRGNIFIRVTNPDVRSNSDLDSAAVATSLDNVVLSRPRLVDDKQVPPRPEILRFEADKTIITGREPVRLLIDIKDPVDGDPHIQWEVGGEGQGYVEADNRGEWHFHATKAGQVVLTLEVTASTGTFASRDVKIKVLPPQK